MNFTNAMRRAALHGFVCLALVLQGCGGGGGDSGTDNSGGGGGGGNSNEAPTAAIVFPPTDAIHTGDTVIVRGTASDDSGVASVSVNGHAASSDDGFATWTVSVPLEIGADMLTVSVTDDEDETDSEAASVAITRTALPFSMPTEIVHAGGTAYVLDSSARAIFEVTAEERTVLSSAAVGSGEPLGNPISFDVSADETTAYVIDNAGNIVVKVDLATGDRSVIASNSVGTGSSLFFMRALVYDDANDKVYVIGPQGTDAWALTTINADLSRTTTTEAQSTGELIGDAYDIEWDISLGRLIVMSRDGGVFSIDPAVGDPVRLTTGADEATMGSLRGMTLDGASDTAYILSNAGLIYSLNINTPAGVTAVVDGSGDFESADALAYVPASTLLVADTSADTVFSADTVTGDITTYADTSDAVIGSGSTSFTGSIAAIDAGAGKAYVYNGSASPIGMFDLATGARTESTGAAGVEIHRMTVDPATGRVFGINGTDLLEIDPVSGEVSELAGLGASSGLNVSGLTHDSDGNRVLYALLNDDDVFEVSLDTLTANTFNAGPHHYGNISGMAMDRANNRLLYVNSSDRSFNSIDLSVGDRTLHAIGEQILFGSAIAINADATSAYLLDFGKSVLLRVDLATMEATAVAGPVVGSSASFGMAYGLDVDESAGMGWTVWSGSLIVFDLETGDHVIISR